MKIALINPPHPYLLMPNSQAPLGLAYLSSMIKKNTDEEVHVINQSHISIEDAIEKTGEYDAYGFTTTCADYLNVIKLVKGLKKKYPNAKYMIGGPHATLSADLIDYEVFDTCFVGEGEYEILNFIRDFKNNTVKQRYNAYRLDYLDELPLPDRKEFDIQGGKIFVNDDGAESTVIIGSRGCPYKCAFCASDKMFKGAVRWRNIDAIIDEIKYCIDEFGITSFRFSDDNMTSRRSRLIDFCKKSEPLGIKWRLSARVDSLDDELLEYMKKSGCLDISIGVESFDINVLKAMNKKITPEQSVATIKMIKKHDLHPRILFMISTPGETYKTTVERNIEFTEQCRDDFDMFSMKTLVPLPGTPLWEDPDKYGIKVVNKDFVNFNYFMYEPDKDGNPVETKVYSNIRIDGMTYKQQLENISEMRKYVRSLPQDALI